MTCLVCGRCAAPLLSTLESLKVTPSAVEHNGVVLPELSQLEAADLLAALVRASVKVVSFEPEGSVLESAYLAMTEERR